MNYSSEHIPTLRICGLTNPIHAINKAEKVLGQQRNHLPNILAQFNTEAFDIIGGNKGSHLDTFCDSTILLPSDFEYGNGISSDGTNLFQENWNGYSFGHFFLGKDENNFGQVLSCIEIDTKAIQETQEIIGETKFQKFEKALGLLMSIMNHDATTHKFGVIALGDRMGKLNKFLRNNLGFEQEIPTTPSSENLKFNPGEVAAAAFHRDMFEEIDEHGVPLKKIIIHNAEILLNFISQISDPNLRGYWITVLKYPLFSLLNPEGEEVENLRQKLPSIKLTPTPWGILVHRNTNECSIAFSSNEVIQVTLREIRKLMMLYYQGQDTNIATPLARLLAEKGGYPITQDWEDLQRMSDAKDFGLPLDTSREMLDSYTSYMSFQKCNVFEHHGTTIYDYDRYLKFKKLGFDVQAWDDREKWRKAFHEEIKIKIAVYRKNGMSIDNAQDISNYIFLIDEKYGFGIHEKDFPEFIETRKYRLGMILESMQKNGGKSKFFSPIDIRDEFRHLKSLCFITPELELLYNSCHIEGQINEEDEVPF